ncbi:MAG: heavy-metal-associated domain-containing protein [Gammaproteobacteria bacterium]|nr:heavy-metal-associated domain-containing protein [Gammaproteobacteria bacterium]
MKKTVKLNIEGMKCEKCKARVENALSELKEVKKAQVSLENKCASVELKKDIDNETLKSTVDALGFEVVGIEE